MQAYITALRHLARHYEFQDWLDPLLCDHLVCGLRDKTLQHRLLAEPELTLTKAIQMARAFEVAAAKTQKLRTRSEVHQEQNRVAQAPCQRFSGSSSASCHTPPQCWRCTGIHDAVRCSYAGVVCHFCSNKGHLQTACRKKTAKEECKSGKGADQKYLRSESERRATTTS